MPPDSAQGTGRALRTPRSRRSSDAKRDVLLQGTYAILMAEGFTALSMDELCRRLKCSKATLYGVAGSKEQLVIAVTKRFFSRSSRRIEDATALVGGAREQILTYLHGVGAAMNEMSPEFYDDMVSFAPTAEIYARNSETAAKRVREIIEGGVAAGEFRPVDGRFAAHLVTTGIESIRSGALLRNLGMPAGEGFNKLGDLILNGIQKHADA